jgi:hypothetical protein
MPNKRDSKVDPRTEQEIYEAELTRHNQLGRLARSKGYQVPPAGGTPPALNEDGSLKNPPSQPTSNQDEGGEGGEEEEEGEGDEGGNESEKLRVSNQLSVNTDQPRDEHGRWTVGNFPKPSWWDAERQPNEHELAAHIDMGNSGDTGGTQGIGKVVKRLRKEEAVSDGVIDHLRKFHTDRVKSESGAGSLSSQEAREERILRTRDSSGRVSARPFNSNPEGHNQYSQPMEGSSSSMEGSSQSSKSSSQHAEGSSHYAEGAAKDKPSIFDLAQTVSKGGDHVVVWQDAGGDGSWHASRHPTPEQAESFKEFLRHDVTVKPGSIDGGRIPAPKVRKARKPPTVNGYYLTNEGVPFFKTCERDREGRCIGKEGAQLSAKDLRRYAGSAPEEAAGTQAVMGGSKALESARSGGEGVEKQEQFIHPAQKLQMDALGSAQQVGSKLLSKAGEAWEELKYHVPDVAHLAELAKGIEYRAEKLYKDTQELAKQVARERGISEEHIERASRSVAADDTLNRWTGNVPLAHAALEHLLEAPIHSLSHAVGPRVAGTVHMMAHTGMFIGAKAAYYLPLRSVASIAKGMMADIVRLRNPFTPIKAALAKIKAVKDAQPTTHSQRLLINTGMSKEDFLAALMDKYSKMNNDDERNEYELLIAAAMDTTQGDYAQSFSLANRALEQLGFSPSTAARASMILPASVQSALSTKGSPSTHSKSTSSARSKSTLSSNSRPTSTTNGSPTDNCGGEGGKPGPCPNAIQGQTMYTGGHGREGRYVTYHTTDRDMAESYKQMYNDRFGEGGEVHSKRVTIANPAPQHVIEAESNKLGMENQFYTPASVFDNNLHDDHQVKALVERLKSKGYDGAVLQDISYGAGGEGKEEMAHITFTGKGKSEPVR